MATIRRKRSERFSILQRDPGPWPKMLLQWLATLAIIVLFGMVMLFSASYTTGYLRMGDMVKAGLIFNLIGTVLITATTLVLGPIVLGISLG